MNSHRYWDGIDISHWNGVIDFSEVYDSGIQFIIAKATEGKTNVDPRFTDYMENIYDLYVGSPGITEPSSLFAQEGPNVGAYHMGRPDLNQGRAGGEAEAQHYCRTVKGWSTSFNRWGPPILDYEKRLEDGRVNFKEVLDYIQGWLDVVSNEFGRKPMIYTGASIWKEQTGNSTECNPDKVYLWQKYYGGHVSPPKGTQEADEPKRIAEDGQGNYWHPTLWQWSGGGDFNYTGSETPIPGIETNCDINRVMGDEDAVLDMLFGGQEPAPIPPDEIFTPTTPPPRVIDLEDPCLAWLGAKSPSLEVKKVQGLLLAHGYGPDGLVGRDKLPDGVAGDKTRALLLQWQIDSGINRSNPYVVDWPLWWSLVTGAPLNSTGTTYSGQGPSSRRPAR